MRRNRRGTLAYREAFWTGRIGIRKKILLYLLILAGFMLSLVWLSQSALMYNIYRRSAMTRLNEGARLLEQNIDHPELEMLANRIGEENDLAILLADEEGKLMLSAGRVRYSPFQNQNEASLREWSEKTAGHEKPLLETVTLTEQQQDDYHQEAFSGDVPEAEATVNQYLVLAQTVKLREEESGVLLLSARANPERSTREAIRNQFVLIVVAVLLATGLVGFTMASSVSEPIIETNLAARELSRSRYVRPPHSGGYREIAELNDTLVQAAENLARVEDLQRELIANISHDLRTPLTMIEGYAEAMRDIPEEVTPENMQIIIDETNRLSTMVNEVLDFSRLRTGNLEMKKEIFNLTELIAQICGRISKMSAVEGYTVVFEPKEQFVVMGDQGRISQVVYNLLGNALTYTGPDQKVTVEQEPRPGRVRIRISDTGEGIAPDELPYIWDRYYRSRDHHRRAVIGSGLGLNICRGILEKHQAVYGVESHLGEGTTFWFELPLAEPKTKTVS